MKVLFSGFRDPYHSSNGGYDMITNMPVESQILLASQFPLGNYEFRSHLMRVPFTLMDIATRIKRNKFDITHLFYGEITMIFCLPYLRNRKHKTVITLHLDIEKRRYPSLFVKILRHFDGIIVLSSQQKKMLKERYDLDSVFIPHGFNPPKFKIVLPCDNRGVSFDNRKINIVTIGNNYRDFDTFHEVVRKMKENASLVFHLVGVPEKIKMQLDGISNVRIYNRLNDNEYYSLIHACDYNFLPLLFATANNTLLEAQSLGIKSILPDIAGIQDYAAPFPLNIYYTNLENLYQIFTQLTKVISDEEIKKYSKCFEWNAIYEKVLEYYSSLLTKDL